MEEGLLAVVDGLWDWKDSMELVGVWVGGDALGADGVEAGLAEVLEREGFV